MKELVWKLFSDGPLNQQERFSLNNMIRLMPRYWIGQRVTVTVSVEYDGAVCTGHKEGTVQSVYLSEGKAPVYTVDGVTFTEDKLEKKG